MKSCRRPSGSTSGFTLIEILIVMLIIGVLAGIAILAFDPFETLSDAVKCDAEKASIDVIDAAEDAGITVDEELRPDIDEECED